MEKNNEYIKADTSSDNSDPDLNISEREKETINLNTIPKRKIGKNFLFTFFCYKKLIGIPDSINSYLITNIVMLLTELGWFLSNNTFYSINIYYIHFSFFLITIYFMFICFFNEPGIIPKFNKNYQINNTDINLNNEMIKLKNKNQIPSILKERKCKICHIIKPPKTSHCKFCDNCVINLDHHSFFISNCIGIRNQKNFFLFCFFGSIASLLILIFNLIHISYIFFFSEFSVINSMYKGNKFLLIISLILIILEIIFCLIFNGNIIYIFSISGIGIITLIILFYNYLPFEKFPSYFNPFSIIILFGSIGFFIFIFGTFCTQINKITNGDASFNKDMVENNNNTIDDSFNENKSFYEKIRNFKNFLLMKIPQSLVDLDNDI